MHLPSLHFARESQSMSFLHPCKGAVIITYKSVVNIKNQLTLTLFGSYYWGISWSYMVLNNTCNPLRPPSQFNLSSIFFFFFETARTVILWFMHCNKTNIKPISNRRHRNYLTWFMLDKHSISNGDLSEASEPGESVRASRALPLTLNLSRYPKLARRLHTRQKHINRVTCHQMLSLLLFFSYFLLFPKGTDKRKGGLWS